jgi:hypothetical protein
MCEFSGKLIAWLDGELAADDAAEVGRHMRLCADCRDELGVYERLSGALDAYCDAAMTASAPRREHYGKSVALGVGVAAVVAMAALLLAWPRAHNTQPSARPAPAAAVPTVEVAQDAPARTVPARTLHKVHAAPPAPSQEARWTMAEPAIQITIPADAVFPPGAVPEGVSFVAEVNIAANGAPQ